MTPNSPRIAGFYWLHFDGPLREYRMMKVWYNADAGWLARDCSNFGMRVTSVDNWNAEAGRKVFWEGPLLANYDPADYPQGVGLLNPTKQ